VTVWLLLLLVLQAQVDEGTFVVRDDTTEVARETFRLSEGPIGLGRAGWRLATRVRYDRARPAIVLASTLEVGSDSQPLSLSFDVADPRAPLRVLGQLSRDRLTVRLLGRQSEGAREFPVSGRAVILDDSVYALYAFPAWRAGARPVSLTAVVPRAGREETLLVEDLGLAATTVNRDPATLRHLTLTGGANGVVHLWLDSNGRVLKIEIPTRKVRVERRPPA